MTNDNFLTNLFFIIYWINQKIYRFLVIKTPFICHHLSMYPKINSKFFLPSYTYIFIKQNFLIEKIKNMYWIFVISGGLKTMKKNLAVFVLEYNVTWPFFPFSRANVIYLIELEANNRHILQAFLFYWWQNNNKIQKTIATRFAPFPYSVRYPNFSCIMIRFSNNSLWRHISCVPR